MKYSEKLKDPRWQKKRLEIFERDEWHCRSCYDGETTLHVHHLNYDRDADPWDYENDNFITLCENCHKLEYEFRHEREQSLLRAIRAGAFLVDEIDRITNGFLNLRTPCPAPEVTASLIEFILSDEAVMDMCWDLFTQDLRKRAE